MNDPMLQKAILGVLARLDGIAVRESILATEVEIAAKRPLTTEEFQRELKTLRGERRVKRDFDPFGEALYEITGLGREALMGRG